MVPESVKHSNTQALSGVASALGRAVGSESMALRNVFGQRIDNRGRLTHMYPAAVGPVRRRPWSAHRGELVSAISDDLDLPAAR